MFCFRFGIYETFYVFPNLDQAIFIFFEELLIIIIFFKLYLFSERVLQDFNFISQIIPGIQVFFSLTLFMQFVYAVNLLQQVITNPRLSCCFFNFLLKTFSRGRCLLIGFSTFSRKLSYATSILLPKSKVVTSHVTSQCYHPLSQAEPYYRIYYQSGFETWELSWLDSLVLA